MAEEKQEIFGHKSLKAGDILVWSTNTGDPFEEAVALMSGDEMTHAALVSRNDTNKVIEQVPGGTTTNQYPWTRQGRTVYVMRRENLLDLAPVLDVAEESLEAKDPLSYKNLLTLAILLLLKQPHLLCTEEEAITKAFIGFFQLASGELTENPNSAYCSEFVYDCYEKAGPEYKLDLDRTVDNQDDGAMEKLFKKIMKHIRADSDSGGSDEPQMKQLKTSPLKQIDAAEHHRGFLEAVKAAKKEHEEKSKLLKASNVLEEEIDAKLAAAILDFARASLDGTEPVTDPVELARYALNNLKTKANLVTPGDLTRIKNAPKVGTFEN